MKIYRKNPVKYNVKIPEKFGGHCLMLENSRQFLVKIRWSDNFTGKGAHIYRKKIPKNYRPFAELPRLLRSICRKIRQNLKQCIFNFFKNFFCFAKILNHLSTPLHTVVKKKTTISQMFENCF